MSTGALDLVPREFHPLNATIQLERVDAMEMATAQLDRSEPAVPEFSPAGGVAATAPNQHIVSGAEAVGPERVGPATALAETDLDDLAGRLYGRIRSRLRSELRADRERAGAYIELPH